ncbi:MAG: nitroreductase family protein [Bacteroidales bacterium]|jgi:predicted oxidoreductase (fatty acid repression mutant protein)|nr:nitroreductase family protein [Bacteroidales bacterium]
MNKLLFDAIVRRRSYYAISNRCPVSDTELEEILKLALLHVPSAFNSQSSRLMLLLNEHHQKVWQIAKEKLREVVPEKDFPKTEAKINAFAAGYGTILFYEDQTVVSSLQERFPLYEDNFPLWSVQTSAMHQFAVWTLLEDVGLGASLQHYNPLIDEDVRKIWNIDPQWTLIAQMPFGSPTATPGNKEFLSLDYRLKTCK